MSKLKNNLMLTNREILALCKDDPTYKNWTSKLTDEIFTEKGFEDMQLQDAGILADFFNLSVRITLNKILTPSPRIPGTYKNIVQEYGSIDGGVLQRINTKLLKPTSPKYRNLINGGSVDPFVVRKPVTDERFFKQNFDFQNMLTIQDIELKKMFLSESGISEYIAGIMKSLDESYSIQKYEVFREMISKMINSTNNPLKDSQKIKVTDITNNSTNQEMAEFLQVFQNLHDLMNATVVSGQFNAKSFEHGLYPEQYTLMIRSDIYNVIKTTLMATTYHLENLGIPFNIELVKDFGGLTYTKTDGTPLVPVYDEFGAVKGLGESSTSVPVAEDDIITKDPNEKISALLVQNGAIFTTEQQPYQTRAIYNPAGLYTNFWASQPNSSFNYDACYDVIEFYHE